MSHRDVFGVAPSSSRTNPGRFSTLVDQYRHVFASVDPVPPHRSSRQLGTISEHHSPRCTVSWDGSMTTSPRRNLPEIRNFLSPPPPMSAHVGDRDKYGVRYGSAGDVAALSRMSTNTELCFENKNNNMDKKADRTDVTILRQPETAHGMSQNSCSEDAGEDRFSYQAFGGATGGVDSTRQFRDQELPGYEEEKLDDFIGVVLSGCVLEETLSDPALEESWLESSGVCKSPVPQGPWETDEGYGGKRYESDIPGPGMMTAFTTQVTLDDSNTSLEDNWLTASEDESDTQSLNEGNSRKGKDVSKGKQKARKVQGSKAASSAADQMRSIGNSAPVKTVREGSAQRSPLSGRSTSPLETEQWKRKQAYWYNVYLSSEDDESDSTSGSQVETDEHYYSPENSYAEASSTTCKGKTAQQEPCKEIPLLAFPSTSTAQRDSPVPYKLPRAGTDLGIPKLKIVELPNDAEIPTTSAVPFVTSSDSSYDSDSEDGKGMPESVGGKMTRLLAENSETPTTSSGGNVHVEDPVLGDSMKTPSGILHRRSLDNRRPSSVRFNNSVLVETFSQTEGTLERSTKTMLAQGDGLLAARGPQPPPATPPPPPLPLPAPPAPHFSNDFSITDTTGVLKDWSPPENRPSSSGKSPSSRLLVDAIKAKLQSRKSTSGSSVLTGFERKEALHRKDSLPKPLSPTDILRQKQKSVTNKILQSLGDSERESTLKGKFSGRFDNEFSIRDIVKSKKTAASLEKLNSIAWSIDKDVQGTSDVKACSSSQAASPQHRQQERPAMTAGGSCPIATNDTWVDFSKEFEQIAGTSSSSKGKEKSRGNVSEDTIKIPEMPTKGFRFARDSVELYPNISRQIKMKQVTSPLPHTLSTESLKNLTNAENSGEACKMQEELSQTSPASNSCNSTKPSKVSDKRGEQDKHEHTVSVADKPIEYSTPSQLLQMWKDKERVCEGEISKRDKTKSPRQRSGKTQARTRDSVVISGGSTSPLSQQRLDMVRQTSPFSSQLEDKERQTSPPCKPREDNGRNMSPLSQQSMKKERQSSPLSQLGEVKEIQLSQVSQQRGAKERHMSAPQQRVNKKRQTSPLSEQRANKKKQTSPISQQERDKERQMSPLFQQRDDKERQPSSPEQKKVEERQTTPLYKQTEERQTSPPTEQMAEIESKTSPSSQLEKDKERLISPPSQQRVNKKRQTSPLSEQRANKKRPTSPISQQEKDKERHMSPPSQQRDDKERQPSSPQQKKVEERQTSPLSKQTEERNISPTPTKQKAEIESETSPSSQQEKDKERLISPPSQQRVNKKRQTSPLSEQRANKKRPTSPISQQEKDKERHMSPPSQQRDDKERQPSSPQQKKVEERQTSPLSKQTEERNISPTPTKQMAEIESETSPSSQQEKDKERLISPPSQQRANKERQMSSPQQKRTSPLSQQLEVKEEQTSPLSEQRADKKKQTSPLSQQEMDKERQLSPYSQRTEERQRRLPSEQKTDKERKAPPLSQKIVEKAEDIAQLSIQGEVKEGLTSSLTEQRVHKKRQTSPLSQLRADEEIQITPLTQGNTDKEKPTSSQFVQESGDKKRRRCPLSPKRMDKARNTSPNPEQRKDTTQGCLDGLFSTLSVKEKEKQISPIAQQELDKKKQTSPVSQVGVNKKRQRSPIYQQGVQDFAGTEKSETKSLLDDIFKSLLDRKKEDSEKADEAIEHKFEDNVTPSNLFLKKEDRERTEEFILENKVSLDYTTPYLLYQKWEDQAMADEATEHKLDDHVTPSNLFQKIRDRERTEETILKNKISLDYTTPSLLYQKREDREMADEATEHKLEDHVTPSILFQKREDHSKIGDSFFENKVLPKDEICDAPKTAVKMKPEEHYQIHYQTQTPPLGDEPLSLAKESCLAGYQTLTQLCSSSAEKPMLIPTSSMTAEIKCLHGKQAPSFYDAIQTPAAYLTSVRPDRGESDISDGAEFSQQNDTSHHDYTSTLYPDKPLQAGITNDSFRDFRQSRRLSAQARNVPEMLATYSNTRPSFVWHTKYNAKSSVPVGVGENKEMETRGAKSIAVCELAQERSAVVEPQPLPPAPCQAGRGKQELQQDGRNSDRKTTGGGCVEHHERVRYPAQDQRVATRPENRDKDSQMSCVSDRSSDISIISDSSYESVESSQSGDDDSRMSQKSMPSVVEFSPRDMEQCLELLNVALRDAANHLAAHSNDCTTQEARVGTVTKSMEDLLMAAASMGISSSSNMNQIRLSNDKTLKTSNISAPCSNADATQDSDSSPQTPDDESQYSDNISVWTAKRLEHVMSDMHTTLNAINDFIGAAPCPADSTVSTAFDLEENHESAIAPITAVEYPSLKTQAEDERNTEKQKKASDQCQVQRGEPWDSGLDSRSLQESDEATVDLEILQSEDYLETLDSRVSGQAQECDAKEGSLRHGESEAYFGDESSLDISQDDTEDIQILPDRDHLEANKFRISAQTQEFDAKEGGLEYDQSEEYFGDTSNFDISPVDTEDLQSDVCIAKDEGFRPGLTEAYTEDVSSPGGRRDKFLSSEAGGWCFTDSVTFPPMDRLIRESLDGYLADTNSFSSQDIATESRHEYMFVSVDELGLPYSKSVDVDLAEAKLHEDWVEDGRESNIGQTEFSQSRARVPEAVEMNIVPRTATVNRITTEPAAAGGLMSDTTTAVPADIKNRTESEQSKGPKVSRLMSNPTFDLSSSESGEEEFCDAESNQPTESSVQQATGTRQVKASDSGAERTQSQRTTGQSRPGKLTTAITFDLPSSSASEEEQQTCVKPPKICHMMSNPTFDLSTPESSEDEFYTQVSQVSQKKVAQDNAARGTPSKKEKTPSKNTAKPGPPKLTTSITFDLPSSSSEEELAKKEKPPKICHMMSNPTFDLSTPESSEEEVLNEDSHKEAKTVESPEKKDYGQSVLQTGKVSSSESGQNGKWSTALSFPEDTRSVRVDLGPFGFEVIQSDSGSSEQTTPLVLRAYCTGDDLPHPRLDTQTEEGSPDRGQRLFGSAQALDRRGEGKRSKPVHSGRTATTDARSFLMDREVMESQNRKLQMEISTLQTENKLMKEKHNRAQGRISDLERELRDTQDELNTLQENLNTEMSQLSTRTRTEIDRDRDQLQSRIMVLTKDNESLKAEVSSLEKRLDSSHRVTDMARHNSEKTRTLEAHKSEITSLQEELKRVKALLEQSEKHLREEETRHSDTSRQVLKLTELKNALQQQADTGGTGAIADKQLKSLESRLKVTEERLHQERSDRANNLSAVEDKLLTENARLQATEKDLTRQLHREKEKNRNYDHRFKELREENEKLRLAMPFDDSVLLSNKGSYDIPYSLHSSQRAENMKISDDMNYIMSQIEKQEGLQVGQEKAIIRELWNKRELANRQLREWELHVQELHIDNNIVEGLKHLRDTYGQAESKLKAMEESVEDAVGQKETFETTYKQQLSGLVKERHEAQAGLKTAQDLLEAVRTENEMLKRSLSGPHSHGGANSHHSSQDKDAVAESLQVEVKTLGSKVAQLGRTNKLQEGELSTLKVQLDARNKALQDAQTELELAYSRLKGDDEEDLKQQKIDKLKAQVNSAQAEVKMWTDKCNHLSSEKSRLEIDIAALKKVADSSRAKQQKSDMVDSKAVVELQDELQEKESRLTSLIKQLDDAENQLQKTRQDLYIEQEHTGELESEMETLQHTVNQRAKMFEALSGAERESVAQFQVLKETLDSVSQELAQKQAQIVSLDIALSGEKDRVEELEREVSDLKAERSEGESDLADDKPSADRLRLLALETERTNLRKELSEAYNTVKRTEEKLHQVQTDSKQLEQELVAEKTVILQISAEKGEVEQHLEELAEEHDALIQEKGQADEDLIKLEKKLQEILQKYEAEARKQHGNFDKKYHNMPAEARKLVSELDSLRLLVEGKQREVDMLQDKISRQNIEMDFLSRKVDLVHSDSVANREDVARMITELTQKMKEAVATRELTQFLSGERSKLQQEKEKVVRDLEQEKKSGQQRKAEVDDVIRKIERSQKQQKSVEKEANGKDDRIVSLEAELRTTSHNLAQLETENTQLKNKMDHLGEDVKSLTSINATLETRLEMEKNSLSEEKNTASKWKEDLTSSTHQLEVLSHENLVCKDKLLSLEETVDRLTRELQESADKRATLQEELHNMKIEADSYKGQLLMTKDTVQQLTSDKGSIYQEYESMCRSLTEKERQLTELRESSERQLEGVKREHQAEKLRLEQEKATAASQRDMTKEECNRLNEQLKQKESQLSSFGRTLQDLEAVTREKKELEGQLQRFKGSASDSKVLLEGQRKELMALNEALAKQQETQTRLSATNHTLQSELKTQKDAASREIHELKLTITELKSQHENERSYLSDNLAQTQTRLRSVEATLTSAAETRDSVQAQKRLQDKSLDDLQSQLTEESTGRRLAEQSVGSLRLQLEDMRNDKNVADARLYEAKHSLKKAETQLAAEREQNKQLAEKVQELGSSAHSTESDVKAKAERVDILQKENGKLRQMIETQKQNLGGKLRKSVLEVKQELEKSEEEREKLSTQLNQLSSDLDKSRELIAAKNKENVKLQEENLTLDASLRQSAGQLKQAQETLKLETQTQNELSYRYREQDEELKRLRNFLAKKVEESGEADKSMWQEMNRVIQELSRQMQSHLDAQRPGDGKDPVSVNLARCKKQLADAQGDLNTERSLHQITKTSLQALEEDCQRLRHQLHSMRKRDNSGTEKKYKNRMEAINAIIARSQTQAQALLASGGYYDDPMNSPRQNLSPRVGGYHRDHSPDTSLAT